MCKGVAVAIAYNGNLATRIEDPDRELQIGIADFFLNGFLYL